MNVNGVDSHYEKVKLEEMEKKVIELNNELLKEKEDKLTI
jgi:hypothetical protein